MSTWETVENISGLDIVLRVRTGNLYLTVYGSILGDFCTYYDNLDSGVKINQRGILKDMVREAYRIMQVV